MPQRRLLYLLKRLRVERDPERREQIIKVGRRALMRWFLMGAKNPLKGVIPLNKRDEQFVARYRADLKIISSKRFSDQDRKKALLKRRGAGFLREVIIRHLLKWDETVKKKREILWPGGLLGEDLVEGSQLLTRIVP